MKNVLLHINSKGDSRQIIEKALSFLQHMDGTHRIFLLKTYLVPTALSGPIIDAHDELQNRSLNKLQRELEIAQETPHNSSISFETILQMGAPVNVIARVIAEKKIDSVILGLYDVLLKQDEILNLLNRIKCPVVFLPS